MAEFSVEAQFEYDAPTFVDFDLLRQGQLDDNDVDQWFDGKSEDEERESMFFDAPEAPSEDVPAQEDHCRAWSSHEGEESDEKEPKSKPLQEEKRDVKSNVPKQIKMMCAAIYRGVQPRKATGATGKGPLKAIHTRTEKDKRPAAMKATASIKSIMNRVKPPSPRPGQKHTPHTPELMKKRAAKRSPAVTSEELEMQEIERLKKEAEKRIKLSRRSFRKLAKTSGPAPVKFSKPTTEPHEPQLRTLKRKRRSSASHIEDSINPCKFPMTLRSSSKDDNFHPCVPSAKPPTPDGITKVKPFKFELDSRFQAKDKGGELVPAAEMVHKFHKTTPERFHSNPAKKPGTGSQRNSSLTMPKTPKLMTKERSRPVTAKSLAQKEEEEEKEMKAYQFKATRLNPEIFTRGGLFGVPNRKTEATKTVPVSPHLATRQREEQRKVEKEEEEEKPLDFVARPVPREILEGIKGVPEKRPCPTTVPESPALASKRRRLEEPKEAKEEDQEDSHVIKANPVPDFNNVFKPELSHAKTEIQPFTFDERDKDKPTRDTLVQQILQKEKRAPFRAQLMPQFGTPSLPPKSVQPKVSSNPFHLQTDVRGQNYTSKWVEKLAEEAEQARRMAEFHAQEAAVLSSEPFIPHKSTQPLTDVSNAVLRTEIRHKQRTRYEAEKKERETAEEMEWREMEALRAAEEEKRLAEYRQALVHKAQPIPHYALVSIKPSDKPLTAPKSPVFRTDTRLRSGQMKTDV